MNKESNLFGYIGAVCSATLLFLVVLAACTSAPVDPTPRQQLIANAAEDALAIGLVPVFTKNKSYIPAAQSIAAALGSFSGSTITPEDVNAFLAKTQIEKDDAEVIAGVVNAAWDTYQRRYAQQVNASVRPDVKVFLSAVAAGITRAIAAVPKSSAAVERKMHELQAGDVILAADGQNTMTYMGNGGWLSTLVYVAPKGPQYVDESLLLRAAVPK